MTLISIELEHDQTQRQLHSINKVTLVVILIVNGGK